MNVSSDDHASPMLEELLEFLYLMPVGIVKFHADGGIDLINPMATSLLMPLTPDGLLGNFYKSIGAAASPIYSSLVTQFGEAAGTVIDKQRLEALAPVARRSYLSLTVEPHQ